MAPLAVALGATIIEKHFTMDRTLPGPDHAASLEPDELKQMIHNIRTAEQAMGSSVKAPTAYKIPAFEVYPKEKIPEKPIRKPKRPFRKKFPTVSIIIDDIGYHRKLAEKLILLDNNLTFSILPFRNQWKRASLKATSLASVWTAIRAPARKPIPIST